jgi:hypothetical protein
LAIASLAKLLILMVKGSLILFLFLLTSPLMKVRGLPRPAAFCLFHVGYL